MAAELHVRLHGDEVSWHLYAACLWMVEGLRARTAASSTYEVLGSLGGKPPVDGVLDGDVDVSITTPIATAAMAYEGRGLYDRPHPEMRAIAALPHRDRHALAIASDVADRYGLRTFTDIREAQPPLRIVSGANDGVNPQGFATNELLRRYGIEWDDLPRWGGEWLRYMGPPRAAEQIVSGQADGLVHDAIMMWHEFSSVRPMRLIPVDPAVLDDLHAAFGYARVDVAAGEYEGVEGHGPVFDWSQWLVVARADLPEEAAYLLAQVIVEDAAAFEAQYRHIPVAHSPLHYPIEAGEAALTGAVPLHPGAAAFYESTGVDQFNRQYT